MSSAPGRTARHYLMCEPTHYTVSYEINPWMDKTRYTDVELALQQ
jgi:N-dimethylarginine dimethylaminohydrolase